MTFENLHQRGSGRAWAVHLLVAGCAIIGALGGSPGLTLGAVVLLIAYGLGGSWRALPANLAAAMIVVLSVALVLGLLGNLLGVALLRNEVLTRGLAVGVAIGSVAWKRRKSRRPAPMSMRGQAASGIAVPALAAAPAIVMVVVGFVLLLMPFGSRLGWFLGGDNLRHVVLTGATWQAGWIDYTPNPYPRAWHALLALAWSAGPAHLSPGGLRSLLALQAGAAWSAYTVLVVATSVLGFLCGVRVGLNRSWSLRAGVLAGCIVLLPNVMAGHVVLGFQTAVVAAVLVAASAIELLVDAGSRRAVLVNASVVALMCHVWQLMLAPAAVGLVIAATTHARRTAHRKDLVPVGLGLLGALVVATPGFLAVASGSGLGAAATPGDVRPLPLFVLGFGGVAMLSVWRTRALRPLLAMWAALIVSALVVAAFVGVMPTSYFPNKMLWGAAVLGSPALAAAASRVVQRLRRSRGAQAIMAFPAAAVIGAVALVGLVNPASALVGRWSSTDPTAVTALVVAPQAAQAQVVWSDEAVVDATTRVLLDFYRVDRQTTFRPLPQMDLASECAALAATAHPRVLTTLSLDRVRARFTCSPALQIVTPRLGEAP